MRAKDWFRADQLLDQLSREQSENRDAVAALINLRVEHNHHAAALATVSRFSCFYTHDAEMQVLFGKALLACEEPQQAIFTFERALSLEPRLPDAHLSLGIALLQAGQPMQALCILQQGNDSGQTAFYSRRVVTASALAQLGQIQTARGLLESVRCDPASGELRKTATENLTDIDKAIFEPGRFYGLVKATQRYDSNTGVVPTTNEFGGSVADVDSFGGLAATHLNYDLFRGYESTLTAGYSGLFTYNYDSIASQFNLQSHNAHLVASRRGITPLLGNPLTAIARCDYDDLATNSQTFLQRYTFATSLVLQDSDFSSFIGSTSVSKLDFHNLFAAERTLADADSNAVEFTLMRNWQDFERKRTHSVGYSYSRNMSQGTDFDYTGHCLLAGCTFHREDTSLWQVQLQYLFRDYDNANSFTGLTRDDSELIFTTAYIKPLNEDFLVMIEYVLDLNDSSQVSNSYSRNVIEIGLQWNFQNGQ